jgi:hypothetical protein
LQPHECSKHRHVRRHHCPSGFIAAAHEIEQPAHIAGHVGKAASSPVSLKRRDNAPIVGEPQQVIPDRR